MEGNLQRLSLVEVTWKRINGSRTKSGQLALSSCCGLIIVLTTTVLSTSYQLTPEVLCRAGAALPQLVLTSATAVSVLFVFSHCDSITCCRRLREVLSTVRKVAPLVVGMTTGAMATADSSCGNWLHSSCPADPSDATYRLPTVLAAVCFIASTAGTILVLSSHMTLRRPAIKMAEIVPVPLTELNATDNGTEGVDHVISGDVTTAATQQTCRISCETVPISRQHDTDDIVSWRCSSKMGLFTTTTTTTTTPPPPTPPSSSSSSKQQQ